MFTKLKTVIVFAFLGLVSQSFAGVITLEGNYQGKNLYIQNPFASSGVGFCTYEVQINGQTTTDEIQSSAFEIDFSFFQLPLGAKVEVKIKHKDECKPKVLNPEVLKPMSTFELENMKISPNGTLNATVKGEVGKLTFYVEQFRWNKWVNVGEFEGKGTPQSNDYTYNITTIHSGENRFRLKQVDGTGKPRYSMESKFRSPLPEVTVTPTDGKKADAEIKFSDKTMYEIFNSFGNIVDKGIAQSVNVSKLEKGTYYVNFDNKTSSFKK
jgi:hypothetical protein